MEAFAVLRLKVTTASVKSVCNEKGEKSAEELVLHAVYSNDDGSPNKQWSKWTPAANLSMTISNSQAFGKVLPGQFFFVDLIPCEKDSI